MDWICFYNDTCHRLLDSWFTFFALNVIHFYFERKFSTEIKPKSDDDKKEKWRRRNFSSKWQMLFSLIKLSWKVSRFSTFENWELFSLSCECDMKNLLFSMKSIKAKKIKRENKDCNMSLLSNYIHFIDSNKANERNIWNFLQQPNGPEDKS